MLRIGNKRCFVHVPQGGPDEDPEYCETCRDCGENLETGIERREELCYTCVRERTGR